MLTTRFELSTGVTVEGYSPVEVGAEGTIDARLESWADLAWFAEQFLDNEAGDLRHAAFFYAEGTWHLGWYVTNGEAVMVTKWFRDHQPDPLRFLTPSHRKVLEESNLASGANPR